MAQEKYFFQSEAAELLKMMIHSVYSNREIFLRELISNASDALDKRRIEVLSHSEEYGEYEPRIRLVRDKEHRMLTIQDNGIGCKNIQKGFGLHHMEERLSMLQGSLRCNGDNGFFIEAKIPIRWGEENE